MYRDLGGHDGRVDEDRDENDEDEVGSEEDGDEVEEDEDQDEEEFKDEETELEKYLRSVNVARAKTAPLKPLKYAEQFKMTPGFS